MAIPPSTREQLIEAIAKFDRDYRNLPEFSGFDSRKNQKYVLFHENQVYPPKMVIHLATGTDRKLFNGGDEANNYLRKYDFEITTISSETRLKNIIQVIEYIIESIPENMCDDMRLTASRIGAINKVAEERIKENPSLNKDYSSTIMSQIRRSIYDKTIPMHRFDNDLSFFFVHDNDQILGSTDNARIKNPLDYARFVQVLNKGREKFKNTPVDYNTYYSGSIEVMPEEKVPFLMEYLNHKPQIILAGPPGTSKTWSAREYVEKQLGARRFENAENEYAESYWSIVQFHPSYGYEDFISGVKAETINDNLTFKQKKGIFLKMAIAAKQNPDKNYYLIIDEINRGVLGRIFGELILTLEYRGLEVHLPDEDEPLNIPENLFLIGTMNTADRNIALVDHALRRRFLIVEMLPDEMQLNNYHDTNSNYKTVRDLTLDAFKITQNAFYKTGTQEYDPDMNGYNMQDYAVGHTYFMADDSDELRMNIKHQVIPLLGEYQREGVITKAAFEKVKSELQRFG